MSFRLYARTERAFVPPPPPAGAWTPPPTARPDLQRLREQQDAAVLTLTRFAQWLHREHHLMAVVDQHAGAPGLRVWHGGATASLFVPAAVALPMAEITFPEDVRREILDPLDEVIAAAARREAREAQRAQERLTARREQERLAAAAAATPTSSANSPAWIIDDYFRVLSPDETSLPLPPTVWRTGLDGSVG